MLHSSFVAPAQGIIDAYFHNKKPLKYISESHRLQQPEHIMYLPGLTGSPLSGNAANHVKLINNNPASVTFSVLPDINEGVIGVGKDKPLDNPKDNVFHFEVPEYVLQSERIYLSYELYGVQDYVSVSRSINDRQATGGHMVKENQGWSQQKEELDPQWLRQGRNTVLFTVPDGATYQYKVRNLAIVGEKNAGPKPLLALSSTDVLLTKDNKIYLKGFIRGNYPTAVIKADGVDIPIIRGEFEGYVTLSNAIKRAGKLTVSLSNGGEMIEEAALTIGALKEADTMFGIEAKSSSVSHFFKANAPGTLSTEGASLHVGENILECDYLLSVTRLRPVDIAPLGSGLINVTKGKRAFRFLPDGTSFDKPVALSIGYDKALIPPGYSDKDVRTFYFDTQAKKWTAVTRDSIDSTNEYIISRTTHFTDYINGIIQTPESPQTNASAPTMMSDLKAADPSAEMTIIAPPSASQTGEAAVSYPIQIPAGRKGMQPNLALQYNSESANGWIGEGWDLGLPALSLDTRWGIPLFDADRETELYSLNGQQLMYPDGYLPHRHQESGGAYVINQQLRSSNMNGGAKSFIPRSQGSFSKIERFGNSPSAYYWKVTTTSGTVLWYGGKSLSDLSDNKAVIRDSNNNIIHWALLMEEDVFGNNIKYSYESIQISGQSGQYATLNGARSLYLSTIYYTGHNNDQGQYQVDFVRQTAIRPDVTFEARSGVKKADPYLLDAIVVKYQNQQIRKYTLGYTSGAFGKRLLTNIRELNGSNVEFYRHDFEYYNDIAANGNNLFKPSVSVAIPDYNANYSLGFGDVVNPSLINTVQSTETGFSLRPSAGFQIRPAIHNGDPKGTLTVGASYGQSNAKNKGKVILEDIDGDGLDDILYRHSDGLRYLSNKAILNSDGSLTNSFETTAKNVGNINEFYKSIVKSETVFGDSWDLRFKKFSAGTTRVRSKSEAEVYFTDANSDGLMDIVNKGKVQFNRIDPATGLPSFTTDSALTPNMVLTGAGPVGEPPLQPEEEEEENNNPQSGESFNDNYDAVRVWIAPASGTIEINNYISNEPNRNATVNFSIEKASVASGSCTIYQETIAPTYAGTSMITQMNSTCGSGSIKVTEGDKLFFRVHKNQSGGNAKLNQTIRIWYKDIYNAPYFIASEYQSEHYNNITGTSVSSNLTSKEEPVAIPGSGTVSISWDNFPFKQNDDVQFEVVQRTTNAQGVQNDVIIFSQTAPRLATNNDAYNPGYTYTSPQVIAPTPNLSGITVSDENTSFIFRAKSDVNAIAYNSSNNYWLFGSNLWRPHLTYTPDSVSQGADIEGFSLYAIPEYTSYYDASYKGAYRLLPPADDPEGPAWSLPNSNVNYTVVPNTTVVNNTLGSSDNATFIFAVRDADDVVIGKRIVNIVNGAIQLPDSSPVSFCGSCNVNALTGGLETFAFNYYVDEKYRKVFEKYLQAVDNRPAVVSYAGNSQNNVNRTRVVSVNYNGYRHLGNLHNNWGQFLYNSYYDPDSNTPVGPFGKLINNTIIENPFAYSSLSGSAVLSNNCDQNLPADQYQQCVEQSMAGTLNIPAENADLSNFDIQNYIGSTQGATQDIEFSMPFLPLQPKRFSMNAMDDKYIGFYNNQYVGYMSSMSGGSEGGVNTSSSGGAGGGVSMPELTDTDNETIVLADNAQTGMKAINKIHRSSSRANSAGWGAFNLSNSESGYSNTVTDFTDLNGDGYPDIVTSEKYQSTTMTGGHREASPNNPEFGDISKVHSTFTGLTAKGSYPISGRESFGGCLSDKTSYSVDYGSAAAYISVSATINGQTDTNDFWFDINGDGLPDRIRAEGNGNYAYQLNTGQSVSTGLFEPFTSLTGYRSSPGNFSGGLGLGSIPAGDVIDSSTFSVSASFDYNLGYSGSRSNTVTTFIDINGDGLLDLVSAGSVKYNTGTSFGPIASLPNLQTDSRSQALAASGSGSLYFGFSVCCWALPVVHIKAGISIGGDTSVNLQQSRKMFKDLNGDGFVDYLSYDDGNLDVSYSAIGRTNKLKKVTNPLGGKFTMDYEASLKSYANPKSRWVMNRVIIEDGYDKIDDGADTYITNYKYENGYYDRRERSFNGFETVKSINYIHDSAGQAVQAYRTSVSTYHNRSYFLKGALLESYTMKGEDPNALFSKTTNSYELRKLMADGTIDLNTAIPLTYDSGGTESRRAAIGLLKESTTSVYEFGSSPIVSGSKMEYDIYGNVKKYTYLGDQAVSSDDYTTEIDYHSSATMMAANLIGIPKEVRVKDNNGTERRKRATTLLDEAKGTVGTIEAFVTGNDSATTSMQYDAYGNLVSITYPVNQAGQSVAYSYTYDNIMHKYVTSITDAYNYTSSSTYDYNFDKVLTSTDISGNITTNEYDTFGRLIKVTGPLEQSTSGYTLLMEYHPTYNSSLGIPQQSFMPFAITNHYDQQSPGNTIDTYTFVDGLARAVQVKKDIEYQQMQMMSVSGKITYDEFGRAIAQFHPTYEDKTPTTNMVINGNAGTYAVNTEYDIMDRVVKTINEVGNTSDIEYSIGTDVSNSTALKTKSYALQNADNNMYVQSEIYKDVNGRVISTNNIMAESPYPDHWTQFAYSSMGELVSYTDAENITTTYEYDNLGRKTALNHADNGTTSYTYDLAGNLIKLQTANLYNDYSIPVDDRYIKYFYDHNRLTKIYYPDTGGAPNVANVVYEYGDVGNNKGRLVHQIDATGEQFFDYNEMGAMISNTRIVVAPNLPTRTFTTNYNYDCWNRLIDLSYPDGENVNYKYNSGGKLTSIYGFMNGDSYGYIKEIGYDYYGARNYIYYGNGTKTRYEYTPELRRLNLSNVVESSGADIMNNAYTYDIVGNIQSVENYTTPSANGLGGNVFHTYKYDSLNRLSLASGGYYSNVPLSGGNDEEAAYELTMEYNNTHGIVKKSQNHYRSTVGSTTQNKGYEYTQGTHKLYTLYDPNTGQPQELYNYDYNGNRANVFNTYGGSFYYWDESNRLRAVLEVPSNAMNHYIYDASGERTLKASSYNEAVYENGTPASGSSVLNTYFTYPSAYLAIDGTGVYTKHYFDGSQRVASRIGESSASIFEVSPFSSSQQRTSGENPQGKAALDTEELRQAQIASLTKIFEKAKLGTPKFAEYRPAGSEKAEDDDKRPVTQTKSQPQANNLTNGTGIYFYHSDHLGTNSIITDAAGYIYQMFLNLPFGETMAEQHSQTEDYDSPYKFNGKELDSETGLYYYGARYYDPRTSIWLSTDPLMEDYPNVNPYAYCVQNPINMVDPDGREPRDPHKGRILAIFYHGGPTGLGEIHDKATFKQSGYTAYHYLSTAAYAKESGYEFKGALIAPSAIEAPGVLTGMMFLKKNYQEGDKVFIYGYSYGGDNAVNLAEQAELMGIPIDSMFIVDSSDGPGHGISVDTSIPDNVDTAFNFYQTGASGGSSKSGRNSDDPNSSEKSKSDGTSNSPASRGYPHTSEGKAKVYNIRLQGKGMSHGQIQNLGSDNIMKRIENRIDN